MYYFDNEESDAPTTIIDLELFDQISRVGDVLIVDASTESDIKPLYFKDENSKVLDSWLSSLNRERYRVSFY